MVVPFLFAVVDHAIGKSAYKYGIGTKRGPFMKMPGTAIALTTAIMSALITAQPAVADQQHQQVRTQSGKVRCDIWANFGGLSRPTSTVDIPAGSIVMCAPNWGRDAPRPGWLNLAVVDSLGHLWLEPIELDNNPANDFVMSYGQTYNFHGWTVTTSQDGTRFTNDRTGHGMFVNYETVNAF